MAARYYLILMLFCMALGQGVSAHGAEYIEVTAPGNQSIRLAVARPVPLSGQANAATAQELADIFAFDLTLAGPFTVMPAPATSADTGIRAGQFSFGQWQSAGADLLLKAGYIVTGTSLVVECRLYDVVKQRELTVKRFTGGTRDLRWMGHSISDEVLRVTTGRKGPFSGKIAFVSTATGNKEIYLMDYDGRNVQRLTKNRAINLTPDFSPSGRELIYTSYQRGTPDLYRRDIASGVETRLTSNRSTNIGGAWSPDGTSIALSMSISGNAELYLLSRDGKQLSRLTTAPAIDISPAWAPDGRKLAFVSDRLGKPQVFIMNSDGSEVRRLTTNGSYNVSPRWSPMGDRIIYCRQTGEGFQIFAINPDGTGDMQLTFAGSNEHPRWSPDGRFITFSSTRSGKSAIYVMRADGSGQTEIMRGTSNNTHPAWSAN
jgi:TolB protein